MFEEMDDIILMKAGECMYQGPAAGMEGLFERCGFPVPHVYACPRMGPSGFSEREH